MSETVHSQLENVDTLTVKIAEFLDDLKNACIAISTHISKLTNQVLILEIITAVISIQGVKCLEVSKRINELIIASMFIVLQGC